MDLLSPGLNSSLDTLYLLKHRDGTEYIVDEIYTASEFEHFSGGLRFDGTQNRYVVHLLWYRHGSPLGEEWIDAECNDDMASRSVKSVLPVVREKVYELMREARQ